MLLSLNLTPEITQCERQALTWNAIASFCAASSAKRHSTACRQHKPQAVQQNKSCLAVHMRSSLSKAALDDLQAVQTRNTVCQARVGHKGSASMNCTGSTPGVYNRQSIEALHMPELDTLKPCTCVPERCLNTIEIQPCHSSRRYLKARQSPGLSEKPVLSLVTS